MSLLVTFDFDEMNVLQKFRSLCLVKHTYLAQELGDAREVGGVAGLAAIPCQHRESEDE